jgi:pimeloyl-ACP methyl ester carboxylesterase
VVLSSTSPNMVMARKLAMFEKLGGAVARELAQKFWSEPTPASWAAYWAGCRKLYNTSEPRDPLASQRTLLREDILLHFVGGEKQGMDLLPGLARAQCPVLVMAGEEDPVCPLDDAREMVAALPAQWVQFASFPGVGHGAWRDDPDAAFATLRRFIQA